MEEKQANKINIFVCGVFEDVPDITAIHKYGNTNNTFSYIKALKY